jgi:hypothetical protein
MMRSGDRCVSYCPGQPFRQKEWSIWPPPALLIPLALVICSAQGCGARSDKLSVSGEVTLNGAPLDGGSIRFTSMDGEKVVSSGAMVQNGEYQVPQQYGLPPGKYHVAISAPDTKAEPVVRRATPGGPGIPVAPDRIPPEYNSQSKQTIEVTPDGENHFVFNIGGKSAG